MGNIEDYFSHYLNAVQVCSHLTFFSPFNGPFFLLPIKWANWVETHSACFLARHHLHNVKQKTARFKILIKRTKRR